MERVTFRMPTQQVEEVEQMVEEGLYPNRSEAIRSAVRDMLNEHDGYDGGDDRRWSKL